MTSPDLEALPLDLGDLLLRRARRGDAADLLAYYALPEVARYQFWGPWGAEQVEQSLGGQEELRLGDPGVPLVLAAELVPERRVVGDCQLTITSVDDRQGDLGFAFHPDYWGRGLATRAVRAALGFAFGGLGLHRVVAGTDVRNERSWRLLERVGMRREAHFRHASLVGGRWIDDYVYAILDGEWRPA